MVIGIEELTDLIVGYCHRWMKSGEKPEKTIFFKIDTDMPLYSVGRVGREDFVIYNTEFDCCPAFTFRLGWNFSIMIAHGDRRLLHAFDQFLSDSVTFGMDFPEEADPDKYNSEKIYVKIKK